MADATASLEPGAFIDVLGPTPVEASQNGERSGARRAAGIHPDAVRAIVRFDYAHGAQVASGLRSAVVRAAAKGRRPKGDRGYRPPPTLKVRLDDPEVS